MKYINLIVNKINIYFIYNYYMEPLSGLLVTILILFGTRSISECMRTNDCEICDCCNYCKCPECSKCSKLCEYSSNDIKHVEIKEFQPNKGCFTTKPKSSNKKNKPSYYH
tara:strand:- start:2689 stop:3018 length:330 start_codon:yes stop_codon:yes gene_type:complete